MHLITMCICLIGILFSSNSSAMDAANVHRKEAASRKHERMQAQARSALALQFDIEKNAPLEQFKEAYIAYENGMQQWLNYYSDKANADIRNQIRAQLYHPQHPMISFLLVQSQNLNNKLTGNETEDETIDVYMDWKLSLVKKDQQRIKKHYDILFNEMYYFE